MLIATTALELLVIGLAVWQLVVVRRSIRRDREEAQREQRGDNRSRPDQIS